MGRVRFASAVRCGGAVATPLLAVALGSVVLVGSARHQADLRVERDVRADVAASIADVRGALTTQLAGAATAADGTVIRVDLLGASGVDPAVASRARDTGTPLLDDQARPAAIVVPIYGTDAPTNSTERRAALTGYRIVPLDLGITLSGIGPGTGELVVRGPHAVVASTSVASGGEIGYAASLGLPDAPGWAVSAHRPAGELPAVIWAWVAGLLALGVAGAVGVWVLLRREADSRNLRARLERNRTVVTGLAPVLKASLDLGEVVPAVAAHLVDGLHLGGLSLTASSERGERQLFATGVPTDPVPPTSGRLPVHLAHGESYALSLTRGGRVLGVLRVVADIPLSRDDLVALNTASELIGSTLANAEAFARQQDLVERMRSLDELKTVFLATASHELRTPVTAIAGFSALLLQNWDTFDAQQRMDLMERVHSNSRRLESLTEQLLDFSRLERGVPRSDDIVLDLGRVVSEILAESPELVGLHPVETAMTTGCEVRGNTTAIERIVVNLVGNAAKYAPDGTLISVTVRSEGRRVVLLVDDQGPGVAEADRERVFSRFYRGSGESVTRTRGAGVGLAIVAEYAASMGAHAAVRESPSGGARFTVSFPSVSSPDPQGDAGTDSSGDTLVPPDGGRTVWPATEISSAPLLGGADVRNP